MGKGHNPLKQNSWRLSLRVLKHLGIILILFALGTLWHEAGHGLAAILFGARVVRVNVLGLQLYPSLAWDFQTGYFGRIWWRGQMTPDQRAWVSLSGNLATMLVSVAALALYSRLRLRGAARTALLTLSFFFLDILAHTLPSFGLPVYLIFGRRSVESVSEGYLAAIALGLPGWVFQAAVVGYALLAVVLIIRTLRIGKQKEKKMAKEPVLELHILSVGEWPTNCYILTCAGQSYIIDPAAEAERILAVVEGVAVKAVLLTHAHFDHLQALDEVRRATGAPLGLHPADAAEFDITGDFDLCDGDLLRLGNCELQVFHTPGHTPGSLCFRFDRRAIVGDTLFPGGPGHSATPEALAQILDGLQKKVFIWPDDTTFYPGHGQGSTIGAIRPAFERFMARPCSPYLCNNVEWD